MKMFFKMAWADYRSKYNSKRTNLQQTDASASDSEASEDGNTACLYCNEEFKWSRSREKWIQCQICTCWAHLQCTSLSKHDKEFVCDIFAALLISSAIHAAPNPRSQSFDTFKGSSVYPNYYVQHTTPFSTFQNEETYDEKTLEAFAAAFGDKDYEKNGDKSAASAKAKVYSTDNVENVNVVNPFLAAKDSHGKLLKSANGLPGVKAAKPGVANAKTVSIVNPFHGNGFDPVFGPEIAPRYEIQYAPQGHSFGSINPFPTTNWNDFNFGFQPNFNTGFGPHSSWYPSSYPAPYPNHYPAPFPGQYPSVLPSYPFPNPFIPGYDPKGLKPKGEGDGGKKEPTTESVPETTSENFQDTTSESSTEVTSESSSVDSTSESSSKVPVKRFLKN